MELLQKYWWAFGIAGVLLALLLARRGGSSGGGSIDYGAIYGAANLASQGNGASDATAAAERVSRLGAVTSSFGSLVDFAMSGMQLKTQREVAMAGLSNERAIQEQTINAQSNATNLEYDSRNREIEANRAYGVLDLQTRRDLGLGELDLQRLGVTTQREISLGEQAVMQLLGLGEQSNARYGVDVQREIALGDQANQAKELDISHALGNRMVDLNIDQQNYTHAENNFGLDTARILGAFGLDTERMTGLFNGDTLRQLGLGDLETRKVEAAANRDATIALAQSSANAQQAALDQQAAQAAADRAAQAALAQQQIDAARSIARTQSRTTLLNGILNVGYTIFDRLFQPHPYLGY